MFQNNKKLDTFSFEVLRRFSESVFQYFDVPKRDAELASDVLAYSDEHGIDSHGIARLKTYVDLLNAGRINPRPKVKVIRGKGSVATIDGDNGLGLVVGPKCMDIAIRKAKKYGSGWVAVNNTNHYGAAGYYPLMALRDDLIGISMTNSTAGVAPFNGAEKMLGTNPIAIAFPGLKEPPIVIDFASSSVSYGKVEIAKRKGENIPDGWCIDKNGYPTNDPAEMINGGALLPLGNMDGNGHKGYCIASMVDILTSVLSGANWGPFAIPFAIHVEPSSKQVGKGIGHFFGVWDIDAFRDKMEFKKNVDHWIKTMRHTKPQPGKAKVLIPGDIERETYKIRMRNGIPLNDEVIKDLEYISSLTGVILK